MESEFNEQLKLKNEIINEFDEYKIKNAAKEAEQMVTFRDLKDEFLKCENEYLKFKQECDSTKTTMQDDLKSMFEKSETILDK